MMLKTKKQTVLNHINCPPNTNIKVLHIKDVCRVCLNSDGSQYTDIFSVKFPDITLTDFVHKLTQIRIDKDDGYPQKICTDCINRYTDSYNLSRLTKESFEKLKSILSTKIAKKSTELDSGTDEKIDEGNTYIIEIDDSEEADKEPVVKKVKVAVTPELEFKTPTASKSIQERVIKTVTEKSNISSNNITKQDLALNNVTEKSNNSSSSITKQDRGLKTVTEKSNNSSSSIKEDETGIDGVNFLMTFIDKTAKEDTATRQNMEYEKRPYACKICNKRFLKRSNLLDHLRLHANVKNFKCPYCDKSFVQSGNYKSHLRVHTNERPYACTVCIKSYQQSSALKIHMRSHTNEKKYICEKCQKGFTNSSDLSKHKLIHDEVKKYNCEQCDKGFSQKVHLTKHLEKGRCVVVDQKIENKKRRFTNYKIVKI